MASHVAWPGLAQPAPVAVDVQAIHGAMPVPPVLAEMMKDVQLIDTGKPRLILNF